MKTRKQAEYSVKRYCIGEKHCTGCELIDCLVDELSEISFKAGYEQAEIDRFRGHMIEAELQGDCQQEI